MLILGINAYHPDASVALLKDGVPIWAAEEERYNRIKHCSGFPKEALRRCIHETQIPLNQIYAVAISKNPRANLLKKAAFVLKNRPAFELVRDRIRAFWKASGFERDFFEALDISPKLFKSRFIYVEHHQTHVASSFFMSGFEEAAFLSIDGMGDFSSAMWGIADGARLQVMDRVFFPHSLGFLYTAATQFLGFPHFGDEYKVMGLAAYGRPAYLDELRRMVALKDQGQFELDLSYFTHQTGSAKIRWAGGAPEQDRIYSSKWEKILGAPRPPGALLTDRDRDIAASIQVLTEEVLFHVLGYLQRTTKMKNLCLAGGVAMNSVANGKITKKTSFERVYIQPAAGDSGTSLGAAAFVHYCILGHDTKYEMNHASLGSWSTESEIESCLKERGVSFVKLEESELVRKTADFLARGLVVGWFQGRMEFGPRALGNRSILADPGRKDMKDILNARIKRRESFRPFAPAVPVERAAEYFDMDCAETPFMLKVFPVKKDKQELLPAITHVDGTARVQTVSEESNPIFWKLLNAFGQQTGIPVLLNTSFNENEPIVCRAEDAVDCFLKTKMDVLVIGKFLIVKSNEGASADGRSPGILEKQ